MAGEIEFKAISEGRISDLTFEISEREQKKESQI
jgi:hypothetical protein